MKHPYPKMAIKDTLEEKLVTSLQKNVVVKQLKKDLISTPGKTELIGGAVIDIYRHVTPKDYDIITTKQIEVEEDLIKTNWILICKTKVATTYSKEGITLQIIHKSLDEFDFIISTSRYNIKTDRLILHKQDLINKQLNPIRFNNKELAINSLSRIPHWESKGFSIHGATYLSLLSVAVDKEITKESLPS